MTTAEFPSAIENGAASLVTTAPVATIAPRTHRGILHNQMLEIADLHAVS
jgi:hypothetical protein